jgi:adenylate kinase
MKTKQFVFLGPPGSGKGTQAKQLSAALAVPHISTGDIFREQIAQRTKLGIEVDEVLKQGQLVSDELTNKIVAERLTQADAALGFVLDGYPRSLSQAEFLASLFPAVQAVLFELTDEESIKRIARRRTCAKCGAIYHLDYQPAKQPGICDACGGELIQRNDQREAIVQDRLKVYHSQIDPLVNFYQHRQQLIIIDGQPLIQQVSDSLRKVLGLL